MHCREAHEVLSALLDDEGVAAQHEAARAHIEGCSLCAEVARDYRHIGDKLRTVARMPAPPDLADKVLARLASEPQPANDNRRLHWRGFAQQAAMLVLVCGLSGLVGWHLAQSNFEQRRLERDVVAAHVRSLLQDSTVQIASSESHTVKPWFNGRVEFAPTVKDLTAEGFPLIGGRLDFVDNRRIATLVYKRRRHVINVFMWPADGQNPKPPVSSMLQGYNTVTWTAGGITFWAVSDLNAKELGQLQGLL
ncbi:MAG TPA: anti-sigma factor [Hyphomicrobiaceae bacterium]|jgi:anti-sigma factor RsiW|nr:anti-sigma factor [Hyphomicrobiaceae bacterium]